ncbi:tyrosine-type recombinase/integrase [Peribacillus sp. SCS-155]|uniref:tyrosine-type recombinase/integrase n=1 Tax=Peribacillus sedimenti TaxID=3115297 RepID=UPI0039064644
MRNQEIPNKELVLRSFAEWLANQNKSESTIKTYAGVIVQFLQWAKIEVHEITPQIVQSYIDFLDSSNKSAGTIEKHYVAITVFSRFLEKPELATNIDRKEKPKNEEPPESLEVLEQDALLKEIESEGHLRNIAIVYTLLHTGIRVSELCDMNISDIKKDKDREYILVRDSKGEIDRVIPLSKKASEHIRAYRESKEHDTDALFISSVNQRITPRSVQYMLNRYGVHPHKLRHTFCQNLIDNGVEIQTVSKLMGHKDLNMTKRYLREPVQELDVAIDRIYK